MKVSPWESPRPSRRQRIRIQLVASSIILAAILGSGGLLVGRYVFPVEELQDEGSFRSCQIGWFPRIDIVNAVQAEGVGKIELVIIAHCSFHVFDNRGKVFVVEFAESGAEPPAYVYKVESYSGNPRKHPFLRIGGA